MTTFSPHGQTEGFELVTPLSEKLLIAQRDDYKKRLDMAVAALSHYSTASKNWLSRCEYRPIPGFDGAAAADKALAELDEPLPFS